MSFTLTANTALLGLLYFDRVKQNGAYLVIPVIAIALALALRVGTRMQAADTGGD